MKNIVFFFCMIAMQPLFTQTVYTVYEDAPLYLDVPEGNEVDSYTWFKSGGEPTAIGTGSSYFIENVTDSDLGTYNIVIDNGNPPDETVSIEVVLQELATDSVGGEYNAQEFIVKFVEGTSQTVIDSLREVHEATVLDTCLCDIELWYIDDLIIDPETKKEGMESEPEIETVDYNYVVETNAKNHSLKIAVSPSSGMKLERENGGSVLVAIIDTGVDETHNNFQNIFWTNPNEGGTEQDDDENCLIGDVMGYDFIDDDTDPTDRRWKHATHLAGLVDSISFNQAEIMNLKIFSIQTKGTLFPGVCATYYAATKEAQIINMSWGWQGLPAKILKNAIAFAGDDCGALVICSAGNEGMNNDSFPHYPSGYGLENIIEVTSVDVQGGDFPTKSSYSNYGNSIDVAVQGTWWSTVPGNTTDSLSGTSISAAVLSGMAARMMATYPQKSWKETKNCILSSAQLYADLQQYSINGKWFSVYFMDDDAMTCMANVSTGGDCPNVFPVSIPILETTAIEKMSISPVPFNNRVNFEFDLENSGDVIFEIYDISGRKVHAETMWMTSGNQSITWDGTHLPKGMYVCYLRNTQQHFSGKMVK